MKKGELQTKEGFTLVEAILVLGIAGMIFLMMMIALPTLQRQERDTERREDIAWLVDKIKKYQTNNRGALPGLADSAGDDMTAIDVAWDEAALADVKVDSWGGFYRDYLGEDFKDPNGENYKLKVMKCNGSITGANCSEPTKSVASGLHSVGFQKDYVLYLFTQSKCAENESIGVVASSNSRKMAILYNMEGGGVHCADL